MFVVTTRQAIDPQQTPAALAPVRDGSVPRAYLLWAAAALLLEGIGDDASGDPDASASALGGDLVAELAGLPGEANRSVSASAEPLWPGESLTESEIRVLRYLPTHM